jgi:hypothetical protein
MVLGSQYLAIVGDTHLSRRLGRSLDRRTDSGWISWCCPDVELSVKEVRLFQPVDNLVCLGGNTGRVRLDMESLENRVDTEEHPFLPRHRGTLLVNLLEERRHRNAPLWKTLSWKQGLYFVAYRIRCKGRLALELSQ